MLITNIKETPIYREFQTLSQVRTKVTNNAAPAGSTQIQTNRFDQKISNGEWGVVNIPLDRRANPAYEVYRIFIDHIIS